MTWLTRILAILNILAAITLVILAGTAISGRIAWTKALADLGKKHRDGQPTTRILGDLAEVSREDAARIRDGKVSRDLDAEITLVIEMLKDDGKRPALIEHLKIERSKLAEELKQVFDSGDPVATKEEKARKILRDALADLTSERQQRLDAGRILFDHAFETTVVNGFAALIKSARERQLSGGGKEYDRILDAVKDTIPSLHGPLAQSLEGKTPDEMPAAAKSAVGAYLAGLRGDPKRRAGDLHLVFMIFAANAPEDEYMTEMRKLPAAFQQVHDKVGPEAAALLNEQFSRYLGPRLDDEVYRIREQGEALRAMIDDLKRQLAYNQREIARFKRILTEQEALTKNSKRHIGYRYEELAELNILVEEAMAGRTIAVNRLEDLKALLALRAGQYANLKKQNEEMELSIQRAEERLRPSRTSVQD